MLQLPLEHPGVSLSCNHPVLKYPVVSPHPATSCVLISFSPRWKVLILKGNCYATPLEQVSGSFPEGQNPLPESELHHLVSSKGAMLVLQHKSPRQSALETHWQQARCITPIQSDNVFHVSCLEICRLLQKDLARALEKIHTVRGEGKRTQEGLLPLGCSFHIGCQAPASQHPVTPAEDPAHSSQLTLAIKDSLVTSKSFRKRMAQRSLLTCRTKSVDGVCRGQISLCESWRSQEKLNTQCIFSMDWGT